MPLSFPRLFRVGRMKLRLRHFFTVTAVVAVWLWAYLGPPIPILTWTAAVLTVLAVFGSSWMTLTALFVSLASLFEFQTCACGHISTWNAMPVTALSCALGWYGAWHAGQAGKASQLVAICVAIAATSVVIKNLEDLFVMGHDPIWPDSPVAQSFLPAANRAVFVLATFTSFVTPILILAGRGFFWLQARTKKRVFPPGSPKN
jgi:hypothetical protein